MSIIKKPNSTNICNTSTHTRARWVKREKKLFVSIWSFITARVWKFKHHKFWRKNYMEELYSILTLITKLSFPSAFTMTIAINTTSMVTATWHFAFVRWNVTFRTFPTFFAMTNATTIMTMCWTKYWTNAWKRKKKKKMKKTYVRDFWSMNKKLLFRDHLRERDGNLFSLEPFFVFC